ncbi:Stk1 family PASTA domain-containing Ser/Thr kinase [Zhihengliuella halotolerans]|uniref:non-specific serine/threonine protein kinase n=1 Tax=Zhihengliuella halotolerans TaxID=370736 RepID=A0A4Q8AC57_9MICC|nr:Stk1 family PASTA domain-containing Ser/Thr kinase [Zhihengliuella halotolerans]RZU61780.1 serine/threonine-protein kinase [Zhihengliuella halotolerans]
MVAAQGSDPLFGATIDGRYRVDSRLARGGMSTVYLATDQRLHREVALKILYPHLAQDPKTVERFEDEAINAAKLSHPHVVNVLDQGIDGENAYLVMEYVRGQTLRHVLREHGRLAPRHTLKLMDAVVEGLSAAHDAGLVHRDMKPENVLLTKDGRVKVADFGLARAASNNTSSGTLVGTVAYISPELVTGEPADERSDIYAVGIMLFELLTGRQPFTAELPINVAFKHVNEAVPAPSTVVPGLATDLDELVEWCTAKNPENRPHDAGALLGELRHIASSLTDAQLDLGTGTSAADTVVVGPPVAESGATEVIAARSDATTVIPAHKDATRALDVPSPASAPEEVTTAAPSARAARRTAKRERKQWKKQAQIPLETLESHPRRRAWLWAVLVLVLAAVLGTAGWFFGMGPGAQVTVPVLQGRPAAEAAAELTALGVDSARSDVYDDKLDEGLVVGTNPPANNAIRRYQDVELIVSRGPELFAVPNIRGRTQDDAENAISRAELVTGKVEESHDESIAAGEVLDQEPAADEQVRRGTEVSFVVSLGPAPVDVPDVTGETRDAADRLLTAAGLAGATDGEEFSTSVPKGHVISQDPAKGKLERGGTVSYIVSKGPRMIDVPNFVGQQASTAEAELKELGFDVEVEKILGGYFGTVRDQDPADGSAAEGSTITITVV